MFTAASDMETLDEVVAKAHIRKENIQRTQIFGDHFDLALPFNRFSEQQCCGSMKFWYIRIRGSIPLSNGFGADPDPAIFVSNLQDVNKKFFHYF